MRRLLLLCAAVAVLGTGCATLKRLFSSAFKKPTLTFRSAELADASLSGATLNVAYQLNNPNSLGLSVAELDYLLTVEGRQVVAGRPPAGLQVRPRGNTMLVFPASFRFADIVPVVQTFLNQDHARYRVEGHVGVQTPLGILRFPLAHEDVFEVPKVPQVRLMPPRVTGLTLQGATLDFPLMVVNRNSYPLPAGEVSGSVSIGGAVVGTLSTGDLGTLEGRGQRQLSLPLRVSFAGAAAAAMAIRNGSGQVGLNGQLRSGGGAFPIGVTEHLSFLR